MKRMPSGGEYRQTLEDAKGMRKGDAPRECAKGMRKGNAQRDAVQEVPEKKIA